MPMSMTGFGRGGLDTPLGRITIEIQSINRKHLEVSVHSPRELVQMEADVRKWVSESIHRGHVTVRIYVLPSPESILGFLPDVETLKTIKAGWDKIAAELKLDPKQIDLPFLASYVPTSIKEDFLKDEQLPLFEECVKQALQSLKKMKEDEGKSLAADIRNRLKCIQQMVLQISEISHQASDRMREKWLDKMKSLLPDDSEIDERIVREIALFAEKIDVVEEITRLHSHFAQFEECFGFRGAVGRKMEFIVQEIGREINTIGSKSADAKISYIVVEMKSELERIREQIQNIE